jgi:hypothetical protein
MDLNPANIVTVTDVTPETIRRIIAHLEVSTEFDHLVYREAELDAVWSITGFILQNEPSHFGPNRFEPNREARLAVADLHQIAHDAHELVAARRPWEAAALLRDYL